MTKPVPLLLIHGYPFDCTMWKGVLEALDQQTVTLAPNMRGFGGTETGNEEPSLEIMADDIADILDRNDISQAVIAGMSMGGYVALAFAEKYPDRLAGLGLISTQAGADSAIVRAARRDLITKIEATGPDAAADAIMPRLGMTPLAAEGARKAGVRGLSWALEAMARRPDRTHVLEELEVPLHVIHGALDQIIPKEKAREMTAKAADGFYVEIANAGHATPLEAPHEVAGALGQLLHRAIAQVR